MIFASTAFLLIFLPLALGIYYLTPQKYRSFTLTILSILFYLFNDPSMFLPLCALIGITYGCIKLNNQRTHFIFTIGFILFLMAYFKYYAILLTKLDIGDPLVILNPLGYSFILFSILSIVIDAYRNPHLTITPLPFFNYILFFPKIFMGPLMRYDDFYQQWQNHPTTPSHLHHGSIQLVKGCFLKVILANTFAAIFAICANQSTALAAWMMLFAYGLQLYFDFYGYTCMAQGISQFFGFTLPDNFRKPYLAHSMQNFWTRWHISLSTWFKDYLYIPLGGNRHGTKKTIRNLLIVWFATGIWHGSSLPYIGWGLYHGCLVITERYLLKNKLSSIPLWIRQCMTFLLVLFGWIAFFQPNLQSCISYIQQLFTFSNWSDATTTGLLAQYISIFVIGFLCISKLPNIGYQWCKNLLKDQFIWVQCATFISMWIFIFLYLIADSYQAFLYFQF